MKGNILLVTFRKKEDIKLQYRCVPQNLDKNVEFNY